MDRSHLELPSNRGTEQVMQYIQNIAYNGMDNVNSDDIRYIKSYINGIVWCIAKLKPKEWD